MTGINWPAFLILATVLIGGFILVRRWYAKDQSRSWAMLIVMVALVLAAVVLRIFRWE